MRRSIFDISASLSLLFCLITLALWLWSIHIGGELEYTTVDAGNQHCATVGLQLMKGRLCLWHERDDISPAPSTPFAIEGWNHFTGSNSMQRFPSGLSWWSTSFSHEPHRLVLSGPPDSLWAERWLFYAPLWEIALCLTLLPLIWIIFAIRRRKRQRTGLCPICGYDLRATPTQCPECGHHPPQPA
jgi:hypothetical protein